MFKNYLTVAIRNLARHKAYTFINVIGLAIGLACSTLILLYLQREFSYDQHHSEADRIYRVIPAERLPNGDVTYNYATYGPVAPALAEDFLEVERATRFMFRPVYAGVEGKELFGCDALLCDSEFFDVFDFPLVKGNAQTGLETPFSIFVTQRFAHKVFGSVDPIGKTVLINSKFYDNAYTITGVLKDSPQTSVYGLAPDLITATSPTKNADAMQKMWEEWFYYPFVQTYILLRPNVEISNLKDKMPDFVRRHFGEEVAQHKHYELMSLTKLHLYGKNEYDLFGLHGDIHVCYALGLIGVFIVLVACINFMNLSTARSARRMREVGMRKVVGAKRAQLVFQFLGESILLSVMSLVIGLGLIELVLPGVNGFMGVQLFLNVSILPFLLALSIGVGVLSGIYPAFFLSSLGPVSVLKVMRNAKGGHGLVRKGLVVVQFAISIVLLVGTLIVFAQTEYMSTADVGFDREALVVIRLWGVARQAETMKAQFLQHSGVRSATITNRSPVIYSPQQQLVDVDGLDKPVNMYFSLTDHDYVGTYGIPLLEGRDFQPQDFRMHTYWGAPGPLKIIVNELAAKQLGIRAGDHIKFRHASHQVVGIIENYHYRSFHYAMRPIMLLCTRRPDQASVTLRVDVNNLPEVMAHLNNVWKKHVPERSSEFQFYNELEGQVYHKELKLRQLYAVSTGLAIAIACLGLLGLIAYTAEVRTKEIGVRKVLGATEVSIVNLLTKEFLLLVGLASVLAWPVAYYVMGGWLENFAYRIELSPGYFVASTGVALVITLITIAYQALKAARANPVEALRYE